MDAHKNLAYTTVATAPSPASSGTSLVVQAGTGSRFPAVPFNATVWAAGEVPVPSNSEIVRVTGIAGDTLTIVRTQEGTLARSVVIGDQIAATITAKVLTDIEDAISNELSVRAAKDDVLSQAISVVSQAVSAETSARIAANNVLSNAISATSAALSTTASALSARIDTVSNAASIVSAAVVVVSALISTTASALSVRIDTQSQGISVLSQQVSALSQAHSVLSADEVSLKNRVSGISDQLTSVQSAVSYLTSAVSNLSQLHSALSQAHSALSQTVSTVKAGLAGGTAGQVLKKNTSTDFDYSWGADLQGGGGGASATVTSDHLSQISQGLSALSQAHSVVSNKVSVLQAIGNLISLQNVDAAAMSAGCPVYLGTSAGTMKKAGLGGPPTIGLVYDGSIAVSAVGLVLVGGQLSLTIAQWNNAASTTSGLIPGATYYLTSASGTLSTAPPAAGPFSQVGFAATSTQMILGFSDSDPNTTSVLNAVSNSLSVISQQVSVLSQQVSALSQGQSALSQAISVLSATLSTQISAISQAHSVLSADHVSLKDRVSAISSNVQSLQSVTSSLSTAVSNFSNLFSTLRGGATSTVLMKSAAGDFAWKWASVNVGGGAASANVTSNNLSILSQTVSVMSNAVSVLSTYHILSLLNGEAAAVSAGAPVYAKASAATFGKASAGHSAYVGLLADGSVAASATGRVMQAGVLSLTTGQWDAITGATGGLTAGETYYLTPTAGALSTAPPALGSNLRRAVGVALDTTHMALRDDAGPAIANDVSVLWQAASVLSQQLSVLSQQQSVTSVQLASVQSAVSALSQALSVLSADELSLKNRVSAISDNLTSVQSAVSYLTSAVSNLSQLHSALSQAVSVISVQVASVQSAVSALSQALSVLSTNYTSLVNRVSANSGTGGGAGSVTSTELSAAVDGVVLSLQNVDGSAVSAGCPVYVFTSAGTFKQANASATSTKKAIGLVVDGSVAISAIGRVRTSGRVTLTTAQWDAITGGSGGLTAGTTYYLANVTGQLTTTAPTTTIRRPIGIAISTTEMVLVIAAGGWDALSDAVSVGTATANALSNAISALSATLSTTASALSQQISVISQQVSVISAGLGGLQMKVLQGAATISTSGAMSNISGLSISVAAGGTYQLQGRVLFNCSAITTVGFGLSYPAMAAMAVDWVGLTSANPGVASITPGAGGRYEVYQMESAANAGSNSAVLSMQPNVSAGFTNMVMIEGLLNVSAAGTVQLAGRTSASPGFVVLKGSFLRAYKIA